MNRRSNVFLLFVACAAMMLSSCGEDKASSACGLTQASCESGNKTLDADKCECVDKKNDGSPCTAGNHILGEGCEPDSLENCGQHGYNCTTMIQGWAAGGCLNSTCEATACAADFHIYNHGCEADSPQNCGSHDNNCSTAIPGWKSGTCSGGACVVTECAEGSKLEGNTCVCESGHHKVTADAGFTCEADSLENCGAHGNSCATEISNWKSGTCTGGACVVTECKDGFIIQDAQCVDCSTVTGWANCDGVCINTANDVNHCGSCTNKCDGGLTCGNGKCLGNIYCPDNNRYDTATSIDACGECGNRCGDGLICDQGACKVGIGEAYCGNDKVNIGSIDHCGGCDKCADGLVCKDNQCVAGTGDTYCDGSLTSTLTDVSNCGTCGQHCDNKICSNGECVDGQGPMYCSDILIDSLTDSANCGGCSTNCIKGLSCSNGACVDYTLDSDSSLICNGKTINPYIDSANCGKCSNDCETGKYCAAGICTDVAPTDETRTYCGGDLINPYIDSDNCSACGIKCDNQKCLANACGAYTRGDIITFGSYEQDGNDENGKEPIEWRILDKNADGQYLLISEKALDRQNFHDTQPIINGDPETTFSWKTSSIRSWLNDTFINTAFDEAEKEQIAETPLSTIDLDRNPICTTTDKLFLLDVDETEKYFSSDEVRKVELPPKYQTAENTIWWLRVTSLDYAIAVNTNGSIEKCSYGSCGYHAHSNAYIRPAMWLNININK